jgi:hypothetical protein
MMKHLMKTTLVLALLSFPTIVLPAAAAQPALTLGNEFLELRFTRENGNFRLGKLVNKLSGRTLAIAADDFQIRIEGQKPMHAADFHFLRNEREAMPGRQRLRLQFEGITKGVGLEIGYELGDHDCFVCRRLALTTATPLPLREVQAWRVGIAGKCSSQESGVPHYINDPGWLYKPEHKGFGLPVLLEDTFWGLAFPGGYNHFADNTVTLTHFPGRTITGRFEAKAAVLGVAENGGVPRRFREYVRSFQAMPNSGLFVNYNTWVTLMPPTEASCRQILDLFQKKMVEPYGVAIDAFTLDDGWDDKNSLWKIRASGFPRGFSPVLAALPRQTRLGLWISPSSGYGHSGWLAAQGYKLNANPRWMCQSDSRYLRDMTAATTDLVKRNDLAFLKLDTWAATCDAPRHEHLGGNFAKEASIDAYLNYLAAIRKANPSIFLDPTCGVWLSPWFLTQANSLWGEVWDGIPPSSSVPDLDPIEGACTSRDKLFRNRCQETPSFPPEAIEHLGVYEYQAGHPNSIMSTLGRGCHLFTMYVDVRRFSDADWRFLAAALKWAKTNSAALTGGTELILGDPLKREAYGYAHYVGGRGIVCLRNPFLEPREVAFQPAISVPTVARIVYPRHEVLPAGKRVQLRLDGYETVILQFDPLTAGPVLAGVSASEMKRDEQTITYKVFGTPGEDATATLMNADDVTRAVFNGRPVTVRDGRLILPFAGPSPACRVRSGSLAFHATTLDGKCAVDVPIGTKAAIHLLVDGAGHESDAVATINGKPAKLRTVRAPAVRHYPRPIQEIPQGKWTFYSIDLAPGHSEIAVTLGFSAGNGKFNPEIGWWLRSEASMAEGQLAVECRERLPARTLQPLPVPISQAMWHETIAIPK